MCSSGSGCYSSSNDLFAFHTNNPDSSCCESDKVGHLVEWECPPSTESLVFASSQFDDCFSNFDLVMFDDKF